MHKIKVLRIAVIGVFLFLQSINSDAESIKIGLLQFKNSTQAQVQCVHGHYIVYNKNEELFRINPAEQFTVVYSKGKLILSFKQKKYIAYSLLMKINAQNSEFVLLSLSPKSKKRRYQDNLIIKPWQGKLKLINEVNLDKYVAGVVQAEAGNNWTEEYYKVQAVISRTYALANKRRHEAEGFHLCDQVHCQVYHHKSENPEIIEAAYLTSGYVITDANIDLVTAAFHSNCGGHTQNSEDVWSTSKPYLVGVRDTFCLKMPHAHWKKTISTQEWKKYLLNNNSYPIGDSITQAEVLTWNPVQRQTNFMNQKLLTKNIRKDWGFQSSFFSLHPQGNQIVVEGKGFGHGVGLCQEGAMRMAEDGYNYQQILQFYYKDIHLIDLNYLDFFRD